MKTPVRTITEQNEIAYEKLVAVIDANSDSLALLIAVCDDEVLRNTIIKRYEEELNPDILAYRLILNPNDPSLRDAVKKWIQKYNYPTAPSVLTVTGAEYLLWLKIRDDDQEKTDIEKFFGYLQWGREGLRDVQRPIVLWVTSKILNSLSRKAPDFWSWRKGVFRFVSQQFDSTSLTIQNYPAKKKSREADEDVDLPIDDLQELIQKTEKQDGTDAPILGTLYGRLAKAYQRIIEQGNAENLDEIQGLTISCYKKAIAFQTKHHQNQEKNQTLIKIGQFHFSQGNYSLVLEYLKQSLKLARAESNQIAEIDSVQGMGAAYQSLSQYSKAIEAQSQILAIFRTINDRYNEAQSLCNLGRTFYSLGQYQKAIDVQSQSVKISHEIGDRDIQASSLGDLGIAYKALGQYKKAIDFISQSLEISHEIGDRVSEAKSLAHLGSAFKALGQYKKAIDSRLQSLEISREIGDRFNEAVALGGLGNSFNALGQYKKAIDFISQSLEIFREIGSRQGEGCYLIDLGIVYKSFGQYQKAIDIYFQALNIYRKIGNRHGEANSLCEIAYAYAKLDRSFDALQNYERVLYIYEELELEHSVKQCKEAIAGLHQIIQSQRITAPTIGEAPKSSDWLEKSLPVKESRPASNSNPQYQWLWYFLIGLGLAILIWWVKNQ